MQQLFGQAGPQGQGVEVFHQAIQLANAARMQAQKRLVQLNMRGQDFLEIGFCHAQGSGVAMRVGVMGASVAVKNTDIAKPDAWLHIGQGDLLARDGGGTHAYRAFGASDPLFGWFAAGGDQVAVAVALDVGAAQDVVLE